MNISSSFNSSCSNAAQGIQRGMQGLANNAAKLASTGQLEGTSDPTKPMLDSRVSSIHARASAKVLAAADGTLGTILNVMA
ncbi:conserved hypothetical protein [Gammaproteobacteria bacterium]